MVSGFWPFTPEQILLMTSFERAYVNWTLGFRKEGTSSVRNVIWLMASPGLMSIP